LVFGFWLLAFGFWLLAFGFWLLVNKSAHPTSKTHKFCRNSYLYVQRFNRSLSMTLSFNFVLKRYQNTNSLVQHSMRTTSFSVVS
jgi:hypothetical protein